MKAPEGSEWDWRKASAFGQTGLHPSPVFTPAGSACALSIRTYRPLRVRPHRGRRACCPSYMGGASRPAPYRGVPPSYRGVRINPKKAQTIHHKSQLTAKQLTKFPPYRGPYCGVPPSYCGVRINPKKSQTIHHKSQLTAKQLTKFHAYREPYRGVPASYRGVRTNPKKS